MFAAGYLAVRWLVVLAGALTAGLVAVCATVGRVAPTGQPVGYRLDGGGSLRASCLTMVPGQTTRGRVKREYGVV